MWPRVEAEYDIKQTSTCTKLFKSGTQTLYWTIAFKQNSVSIRKQNDNQNDNRTTTLNTDEYECSTDCETLYEMKWIYSKQHF
jgi:hypothetical protein